MREDGAGQSDGARDQEGGGIMSVQQEAASGCGKAVALLAIVALIGFGLWRCERWLGSPVATVTQPPAGAEPTPTWRAATEADLKAGTQLYWKTLNGFDPWAVVVSGEIQAKPDGDRLVLVRFPTGVEEWKSVEMVRRWCAIR